MSGRRDYYKQHSSLSFRRRRQKTRLIALFVVLLTGIVVLGVLVYPFNDASGRKSNKNTNFPTDIGYAVGGTPVPIDPSVHGSWPFTAASSASFQQQWERLDSPIKTNRVTRGWSFGAIPGPVFLEPYQGNRQNLRLVQYWDKARMQIDPTETNAGSVALGALAIELISGEVKLGEQATLRLGASPKPIIGPDQEDNAAPSYSALAKVVSLKPTINRSENQTGLIVTTLLNKVGQIGSGADETVSVYNVKNTNYIDKTGHNIPNVFWDYLTRSSLVATKGNFTTERLFDWEYQFGQPVSEAYWIKAKTSDKVQDMLIQVFEQQILVYNPANKPEMQVDTVNIGRQYYEWRYPGSGFGSDTSLIPTPTPVAPVASKSLNARFNIGNETIQRTIVIESGRMSRNTLVNRLTGQVYADILPYSNMSGFSLRIAGVGGSDYQISGDQFNLTDYAFPTWNDTEKVLELRGELTFLGQSLKMRLYYRALPGQNFIEKWFRLEPNTQLKDAVVRQVAIEDTAIIKQLKPAAPTPEEDVLPLLIHFEETSSVPGGAIKTDVLVHENASEGLYFFSATPLGGEYATDKRVTIMQEEYQSLNDGFTSGKAVLGAYSGRVDLGFKRFTEYLENFYSKMAGKKQPVWYSTWYPFGNQIDQNVILGQLDQMQKMGIYDLLHIDAGWEDKMPLQIDTVKFPQGLKPIAERAASNKINLGLWLNPFSNSYSRYVNYDEMHKAHPEWHIKGLEKTEAGKNFAVGPFGVNTDYYYYVRDRLLDLVKNNNISSLYWDGADWNIPDASAPGLSEEQQRIERVKGTKRLVALTEELRKIRPDIIIVGWNSTANVHLLGAVEQLQLSDNWSLPIGTSELARQQQFYAATYHLPYYSIWGDWYSITYKENGDKNLDLPLNTLSYAELSMIGAGGMNAGVSLDLNRISPDLQAYLRKLFTWRKRFEPFFQVYQHIFDYPSEGEVYGEGHVVNGQGFILLNNPTKEPVQLVIPLTAPELELDSGRTYNLSDWSNLTSGKEIGPAKPGEGVSIVLQPRSIAIIGIDVNSPPQAQSGN